ncbi:hypothetical protein BDQ17DRAFT_1328524 [Cyathus striatus]|nr:hypothetical protein BDQ17DRAFT_1328524 [Cyathus striatus]
MTPNAQPSSASASSSATSHPPSTTPHPPAAAATYLDDAISHTPSATTYLDAATPHTATTTTYPDAATPHLPAIPHTPAATTYLNPDDTTPHPPTAIPQIPDVTIYPELRNVTVFKSLTSPSQKNENINIDIEVETTDANVPERVSYKRLQLLNVQDPAEQQNFTNAKKYVDLLAKAIQDGLFGNFRLKNISIYRLVHATSTDIATRITTSDRPHFNLHVRLYKCKTTYTMHAYVCPESTVINIEDAEEVVELTYIQDRKIIVIKKAEWAV